MEKHSQDTSQDPIEVESSDGAIEENLHEAEVFSSDNHFDNIVDNPHNIVDNIVDNPHNIVDNIDRGQATEDDVLFQTIVDDLLVDDTIPEEFVVATATLAGPIILEPMEEFGSALATVLPPGQNPAHVYLAGLGNDRSRRVMENALRTIAGLVVGGRQDAFTFPWAALRFQHTAAIQSRLAASYAPGSANRMMAALRGVLKAAWKLGQMTTEDYHRARETTGVKGETLPRGRSIPSGEMRALFQTCAVDKSAHGARDAALMALLYGTGLRRAEVVALNLEDYDRGTGEIKVLHGKGNKARTGYATHGSRDALEAWLLVRGEEPGPLFLPITKGGKMQARRLRDQAVMDILLKRVALAGIPGLSPHDFRRTFISDLLDAGADISTVQKMAGHSNVTTTARYDRRGEGAKKKAAELLHVPFQAS